jgi:hypothetical protein
LIPAFRSLELSGVLINDACAQHVRHVQNLLMYFVKRGKIRSPIALKPRDDFRQPCLARFPKQNQAEERFYREFVEWGTILG